MSTLSHHVPTSGEVLTSFGRMWNISDLGSAPRTPLLAFSELAFSSPEPFQRDAGSVLRKELTYCGLSLLTQLGCLKFKDKQVLLLCVWSILR